MIRHPLTTTGAALVALVVLAGCTSSGSSSTPTRASSSPATVTGTAPTAPVTSAPATCTASSTTLTYRRHIAVVSGYEYGLPPGGRTTTPQHLPVVTVVRASAPGLGAGAGLTGSVSRHWHTMAVALGSTTAKGNDGRVGLRNSSKHNESYAVYNFVHVFTGRYSSVCGGAKVAGTYRTFGPRATVVVGCGEKIHGKLDRLGHRLCS